MRAVDLAQLVNNIGDSVVVTNVKGDIVFWNPASTRIFGFTEAEAVGSSLDIIIPERQRGRHWEGYEKTVKTGETRYGTSLLRVPALHKEGKALSIAFTVALLHDEQGEVSGIVAVIRDDTTRFQEDRAMRKRVMELEAQLAAAAESK